jgi:hypothetical protein
MSRVLLVALDQREVTALCAAEKVEISAIEGLTSGGVRLVCSSGDGAARMAKKLKTHLIEGEVIRERRRPTTSNW